MSVAATNVVTSDAYLLIKRNMTALKSNLQEFSAFIAVNAIDYDYTRDMYRTMVRSKEQLAPLVLTPGLDEYAIEQEPPRVPEYDFTAEYNVFLGTVNTAIAWIDTNVPTSATVENPPEWDDAGSMIVNEFTPTQFAQFKIDIDAVIAEIE